MNMAVCKFGIGYGALIIVRLKAFYRSSYFVNSKYLDDA